MFKFAKLINVSKVNNNKYYEMEQTSDSEFIIKYGRVGAAPQKKSYPISRWYTIYNDKIRKGYTDITQHIRIQEEIKIQHANSEVQELFDVLSSYAKKQMTENYYVDAKSVTKSQLDTAKNYLEKAYYSNNKEDINNNLLEVYRVIPRKMKNVNDYLYKDQNQFDELYNSEIQLLDNLICQSNISETISLSDNLGLQIEMCNSDDLQIIHNLISSEQNCNKNYNNYKKAFKVKSIDSEQRFQNYINENKNKKIQHVWHGSRAPNWLSILKNGLKIRPSNAYYSGSAYGDGIYGSTCFDKSYGYTGSNKDTFMAIMKFHVGNQYEYNGWNTGNSFSFTYNELKKRGYDSTFVKPGGRLLNNEYVIYNENQTTIAYLLWI